MGLRHICSVICVGGILVLTDVAQGAAGDAQSVAPEARAASSERDRLSATGDPTLTGRLLFSRFDEASHTFLSTHISRPDGSEEREIAMPGDEGGGRWSRSGDLDSRVADPS